jgi:Cu/Ag efflux protein CusF
MIPCMAAPPLRRVLALAPAVALALLLPACRGEPAPSPATEAARRYTVRGELLAIRDAPRELTIRHEAIDDFADRSGAIVGMNAMVMPFPVDRGVPIGGLAPGDKVRVRFSMDWEKNRFAIESIEKLPTDTPLEFGKARPAR